LHRALGLVAMRRHLSTFLVAAAVAIALSWGLFVTTWSTAQALERDARLKQHDRGRDVASQLEAYLRLSQQVADSTATLISPVRQQEEAETLIRELLASTSPDFVYGIGVWYEPYRFDPRVHYFGPYAHRSPRGSVVTYEWSTPEYDYPSHPWYLLGRSAKDHPAFTEPYFDIDHVYMTTARSIFNAQGEAIGVISVDLILPQLQRLVEKANASPDERVFVLTSEGHVFAYPEDWRLLQWARDRGRPAEHLINVTEQDVVEFERQSYATAVEQAVPVEPTGWRVQIATSRGTLFAESDRVKATSGVIEGLGLVLCVAACIAHLRARHADELSRELGERKRVEIELRENLRARDEFFSVVAHEFKTPIYALSLRLQQMQKQVGQGRPIDEATVGTALDQTRRLDLLITDMLDVAKMRADRVPLELAPTGLIRIVRAAIADVAPLGAGQKLAVDLPPEEMPVLADAKRIEQVIANLIDNAIKYSPSGGTIWVSLERRAQDAILCVRDEGIGIPADQLPHVFERYFRGRNAPVTSFGGLGLGLYISREIVSHHQGRVWVESVEGKGSAFFVALPMLEATSERGAVQPVVH
jgi:signal transduction histidine kinase